MNSHPLPRPSLLAVTLPPCKLDQLLDDRQPDAESAFGAGQRAVALGEQLEHLGQLLRERSRPRSRAA